MTLTIEKGVPIPGDQKKFGLTETLRELQVGDSFVYPKSSASIYNTIKNYKVPGKFTVRKIAEGYRCWRTE